MPRGWLPPGAAPCPAWWCRDRGRCPVSRDRCRAGCRSRRAADVGCSLGCGAERLKRLRYRGGLGGSAGGGSSLIRRRPLVVRLCRMHHQGAGAGEADWFLGEEGFTSAFLQAQVATAHLGGPGIPARSFAYVWFVAETVLS